MAPQWEVVAAVGTGRDQPTMRKYRASWHLRMGSMSTSRTATEMSEPENLVPHMHKQTHAHSDNNKGSGWVTVEGLFPKVPSGVCKRPCMVAKSGAHTHKKLQKAVQHRCTREHRNAAWGTAAHGCRGTRQADRG
jgi:hypothetical protein